MAAAHPDVVAALRADYERWWATVEPRLGDFVPLSLGSPRQASVELTSSDWQDLYVDNTGHVNNAAGGPRGGRFNVLVERAGNYEFVLRRWPERLGVALVGRPESARNAKALPIAAARLEIAGQTHAGQATPGAQAIVLRVPLPAGRTTLQAWFQDKDQRDLCGAFYVRVTLSP